MENDSMQWYTLTGVLDVSPCGSSQLTETDEKVGIPLFFFVCFGSLWGGRGGSINESLYVTYEEVECGRERMK